MVAEKLCKKKTAIGSTMFSVKMFQYEFIGSVASSHTE